MSIDKFMKAIEDVTSFIGANNDGDHWGTITWHDSGWDRKWNEIGTVISPDHIQKRSGNERRDEIKKVPKKVKAKRKSVRRK